VGVKCKDGVILASEKMLHSKLLMEDSNRVIHHVDTNIGIVFTGHLPDGKNVLHRAKKEAESYRENYGIPITGKVLVERISMYIHAHTLYMSYRPFGTGLIVSACDDGVYSLYMIDPSGAYYVRSSHQTYRGCTMGKGRQVTKAEIEKHNFADKTVEEALPLVARMIVLAHKEMREKRFEFEASWISDATKGIHKIIDKDIRKAVEKEAEDQVEREMMEE
jgi:20S proteasome subunit alpha 7